MTGEKAELLKNEHGSSSHYGSNSPSLESQDKIAEEAGSSGENQTRLRQSAIAFLTPLPCRVPTSSLVPSDYKGETEYKYIQPGKKNRVFERMIKILHDNRSRKKRQKQRNFIAAFLLLVGIFVDGLRPIALFWAKNGEESYPFSFPVWIVVTKSLVVFFSLIMYFLAPLETRTTDLSVSRRFRLSSLLLPPVILYVISDTLNFFMFELISPSTFSVVKQSRLVIVAVMNRFLLGRYISQIQWVAVLQLLLSSVLFEAESFGASDSSAGETRKSENFGILLLLFKCTLDSLAIIWMDMYFKHLDEKGFPYPQQQVIFAIYSVIVGIVMTIYQNGNEILFSGQSLFHGWNTGASISAFLAAFYGLLISIVLRYLNSMVKMFQSLAAVIVTILFDKLFFGERISAVKSIAVLLVLLSVFLYKLGTVKISGKV
mmetsp:Transcript_15276/g.18541  ORF Transcript_15276/g.18541 Transcript_15276/m.18541 type:complete len:430 (-) Transcript_15276:44-1333(-)